MVTRSPNAAGALTREEREVWLKAYLAAELPTLLGSNRKLSINGAVHLCQDWAWASLDAYRKAAKGDRS